MKPLRPSHREKKRYLLLSGKDARKENVEEAILKFVGILGFAKASFQIIKKTDDKLIISINHTEINNIRAAFLMSGKDIKIEKISGTLKKLGFSVLLP